MAPNWLARRQKMPHTNAGKNAEAASEKAFDQEQDVTRLQRGNVSHQLGATTSNSALETRIRRVVEAFWSIIL